MKMIIHWTAFMLLFAFVNGSCAQSHEEKIDELVTAYSKYGKFNGAVLVAKEGKIVYNKGLGYANMEWNIPNESDSKFRIASITKQFTAMLVLQLVYQGKIDLQAPISTYLPEYPKDKGDIITVHQLLTHTSGIPDYGAFPNYREFERERFRAQEIVELFADSTLEFTPGERYNYSNSGYVLLGIIIENVSGKPFEIALEDQILDPLGMKNSGYDHQRLLLEKRVNGYYRSYGKYYNTNLYDMSLVYAAGAMYSTVEDLFLWDQALYTEQLLPKEYMDLLFEKYVSAGDRYYGYGWFMGEMTLSDSKERVGTVSHSGGMDGFRSKITRIPSEQSLVVLLDNAESRYLYEMTYSIQQILLDQSYSMPDQSVAYALLEVIEKEGLSQGLEFFEEKKYSHGYYLDIQEMNAIGYDLLYADKKEEAAAVFKLNMGEFPRSCNVYDSYGEALMALGNEKEAIAYYKRALELDPENRSSIRALKQIGIDTDPLTTVFDAPSYWKKEQFPFPISFAPSIDFIGYEDIRFAPHWSDSTSQEFWTYTFAWYIDMDEAMTDQRLSKLLEKYYDGLMRINDSGNEADLTARKTEARVKKKGDAFEGEIWVYDNFFSKKMMTLYVQIEDQMCEQSNKQVILFRLSPQTFKGKVWKKFDEVKLSVDCR